jgi:cation diffusion facilitator CzcD-associated flavoprotein CzcO
VVPHSDRRITNLERKVYRRFPVLQRLVRAAVYWSRELLVIGLTKDHRAIRALETIARVHMCRTVRDHALRAKLTPDYRFGCKRILPSNHWYPAINMPNVEVVTDAILEVKPHSIVTADGSEREVDTIVLGTGFHVTDSPATPRLRGKEGRLLTEVWGDSPQAYLGTTVAGFPNLFFLSGPNTGTGHTSQIFMIESQLGYVLACIRTMHQRGLETVEVRPETQGSFNREVQSRMPRTVWLGGGCSSWYIDSQGRNTSLWPDWTFRFRRRTRNFDPASYVTTPANAPRSAVVPVARPPVSVATLERVCGGPPGDGPNPEPHCHLESTGRTA